MIADHIATRFRAFLPWAICFSLITYITIQKFDGTLINFGETYKYATITDKPHSISLQSVSSLSAKISTVKPETVALITTTTIPTTSGTGGKTTSTIEPTTSNIQCKLQKKVIFLKTYKTGSETLAGIFRRFAVMQDLSLVLSEQTGGHLYWPRIGDYKPLSPNEHSIIGWGLPGAQFDVIANHMTWNKTFINSEFPPETKKITILRDPVTLLASAWKYYYVVLYPGKYQTATTEQMVRHLDSLLQQPTLFYNEMMTTMDRRRHTLRSQLYSFHGERVFERDLSKTAVNKMVKEIDDEFDLVLIMEYYDLGLALMALELCWPLKYASYLKINVGRKADVKKKNYHEELIRVVNYPDFMLYEYFNRTFWERINKVGLEKVEAMAEEIRSHSEYYLDLCVSKWVKRPNWNNQLVDEPLLKPDKENSKICKWMTLWGNRMSEPLKDRQREMAKSWI